MSRQRNDDPISHLVLHGSVLLLIVSIWFPGATRIAGTDGSLSFLLALVCAVICVPCYGDVSRRLHRTEAVLVTAVLSISALIIILSLLSMVHADSPIRTFRAIFAQIFGFAVIPATVAISLRRNGREAVERVVTALIVMSFVTSVLVTMGLGNSRFADRAEGYFKHSNQLGIALSAGLPLVAARLVIARKHRLVLLGCLLGVLVGLVKSGSKTNFVVGVAGLGVFFGLCGLYLMMRRQRPVSIIAGAIVTPLLIEGSLLTLQHLNPRAYRLLLLQLSGGEADSVADRERLWSISIDLGLSHPFGGVGAGQPVGDIAPHSHNLFIEYFRTLGVPGIGLIALLVIVVMTYIVSTVLHTIFKKDKGESAKNVEIMILASAVSVWNYIVANQMSDSFGPSTAAFFWIPLALLVYYRGLQRSLEPAPGRNTAPGVRAVQLASSAAGR